MDIVDLRSDTVTRPTEAMYEAMRAAPLGDDVYSDDPTVNELEALAARTLGTEAALFVPSGTMGNQIAVACHTKPGDAMIAEEDAHIMFYELGGPAMHAQVVTWTLPSHLGTMEPALIESHILKRDLHKPGTSLLCVENTHNRAGGTVIPLTALAAYREIADGHKMKIHMDGARVFHAAIALGLPVADIAQYCDSVCFCLSKGLRSPIGSVLCGSAAFIDEARIWRKRMGGGMRQAGILAACGMVSLTQYVNRLAEDHQRAWAMAERLSHIPGLEIRWETVQTNILLIWTELPAQQWVDRLHAKGIWSGAVAPHRMRLIFHADVDDEGMERAAEAFESIVRAGVSK